MTSRTQTDNTYHTSNFPYGFLSFFFPEYNTNDYQF